MNSLVRAAVRLCTATGVPRRAMLRARLAPITASPVTPILLGPVDPLVAAVIVLPRRRLGTRDGTDYRCTRRGISPGSPEPGEIIRWLHLRGGRDDVLAEALEHPRLGHPRHPAVHLLHAELRQALE